VLPEIGKSKVILHIMILPFGVTKKMGHIAKL